MIKTDKLMSAFCLNISQAPTGTFILRALPLAFLLAQSISAQELPEEIVVTASKRESSLRQLDISMDVISSEAIESFSLNELPELADLSENVALFEDLPGSGIPTWVIRGVGLQDFNSNNTPAAGVFLDGAYQVSTAMGAAALYDIDQVEILKGPQGGLYGRNTSGGAVLLNTARANLDKQDAYIEFGLSRWDRTQLQGAANMLISDDVAVRIAGKVENAGSGWQESLVDGQKHGEEQRWDLRSWLLYEPNEVFKLQFKLEGGVDDSDIPLGTAIGLYDPANPFALCSAQLLEQRSNECLTFAGLTQLITTGEATEDVGRQSSDGTLVLSDPINKQGNDYVSSVLDLQWQGQDVRLVSLTTIDQYGYGVDLDLDGSRGEFAHRFSSSDIEVISQEFRILNSQEGRFDWMIGVAFSSEEFKEYRDFALRDNVLVGLGAGVLLYQQDTTMQAVYGDFQYEFTDEWKIKGTLRNTQEEKSYLNGDFFIAVTPPIYFVENLEEDYDLDSNWSGSAAINFTPSASEMWYLKYSSGFKSGGFYGGFPFSKDEVVPYKEETIAAVELGVYQYWQQYNLQLNAAIFSYDYSDVQGFITEVNPVTNTAISYLGNQGDAVHKGGEIDLQWSPNEVWKVGFGLGYLDAKYKRSGVMSIAADGNEVEIQGRRPWAPRWNMNAVLTASKPLSASLLADASLMWSYRSEFSGHHYSSVDRALLELPAYSALNASLGLRQRGEGSWSALFWVKNLTNADYKSRVKSDGLNSYIEFFAQPRSYGVSLKHQF